MIEPEGGAISAADSHAPTDLPSTEGRGRLPWFDLRFAPVGSKPTSTGRREPSRVHASLSFVCFEQFSYAKIVHCAEMKKVSFFEG